MNRRLGLTPVVAKWARVNGAGGFVVGAAILSLVTLAGCGAGGPAGEAGLPRVSEAEREPAGSTDVGVSSAGGVPGEAGGVPGTRLVSTGRDESLERWQGFRGPSGMGISRSTGVPVNWSETENLAWKVELPGPGASSPIVQGDRIYVTCYSGYFVPDRPGGQIEDLVRHLIALRRTDGERLWEQKVPAKLPEESQIRDHGYAANTPAADADQIYVFFGKSGLFAFDHEGNLRWQADLGSGTNGWGTAASPLLFEDLVIVNASVESESLIAVDRSTGKERWRVGGIRESWNTPVIVRSEAGRTELVVAKLGDVLAFDPRSGEPLWSCKTDITWYMVPSLVAADGVVYCLGGRSGNAGLAVRAGGSGDVTATHRLWTSTRGSNVTSPIFTGGYLYWMHEQRGTAYCADGKTGDLIYEQRLDRAGQVYASAILVEGNVHYLTRDGKTYVVRASPEFELVSVNDLRDGSNFDASPAIDGSRMLIRSNRFLYCIGDR